ncbi:metallophosphoesterase [Archangium sp. Cb G35]|uniref:metallophosphoesterase n=1 Tax=Archangium sp. Cb G35 TaxID=1920190 RepID=UPI000A8CE00D|nr:metallophosphoesterase [Archangium sp. Cb G35]
MASGTETLTAPQRAPGGPPERPQGRKMVRWFDPFVLLKAGVRSTISTTIGEQADRRLLDALAAPKVEPSDFSVDEAGQPREELWLDYVADLGDGWDSTYAVAQTVSRPALTLRDETGTAYETRRGEVLVFGGDEVYPEASVKEYEERTVRPWEAAMRGQGPAPHLFAVPGNHDWYDGLVSFMRLFCQGRRPAGWHTHQRRSYFAVKLPHGWWLLGTDMQLESDIDEPQVQYFQELAKHMKEEDRIILCLAEPAWLVGQVRPPGERTYLDNNLDFLEQQVLGKKVSVFLTGDIHHYRRHANEEGRQKIIAGGGGAFLHPTHVPRKEASLPDGFTARKTFPSKEESRRLCWRNLGFLGHNPSFGVLTGLLYLLLAWMQVADLSEGGTVAWKLSRVLGAALVNPGVLLLSVMLVLGMVGLADARFGRGRWVVGVLHGVAHLAASLFVFWGAFALTGELLPLGSVPQEMLGALLVFAGGFLLGPTLMGVYLLVSLNGFEAHANEAFSSLTIPDWKNFLRLRIDREGRLWLYPIGLRRVPRNWKRGETARDPEWVADDKDATPPELIEPPIVIGAARPTAPRIAGRSSPEYAGPAAP